MLTHDRDLRPFPAAVGGLETGGMNEPMELSYGKYRELLAAGVFGRAGDAHRKGR